MMEDVDMRRLGVEIVTDADGHAYRLGPSTAIVRERGDHRLLVHVDDEGAWIVWALFERDGADDDGDVDYSLVAHGCGISGALREARHTYFGERDGYLFYVNPGLIAWAFEQLREWFDFDG